MDKSNFFSVSSCVPSGTSIGGVMIMYSLFSMDETVEFAKLGGNAFMKAPVFTEFARFVVKFEYSAAGFD